MLLKVSAGNNITESAPGQNEEGFINGTLYYLKSVNFIGNATDFNFLGSFSKVYSYHKENPQIKISDELYAKLYSKDDPFDSFYANADRIVQYSIFPEEKQSSDSLNIYCKYILYEKKKSITANKNNYDISFNERFYTVPANRETTLEFLKEIFPEAEINNVVFNVSGIKKDSSPVLYLSWYGLKPEDINEDLRKISFRIDAEYIQSNKKGDEIFADKKFTCPTITHRVFHDRKKYPMFLLNVCKGFVHIPFRMFNPTKQKLFAKSKEYKNSEIEYSIYAIPLDVKDGKYTFNVIITRKFWGGGGVTYSKKIGLEIDKPLRIELDSAGGLIRNTEVIDGELLHLDSKKDFADYVNEYIVITLQKSD
jgi:hypothetical protein